VAVNQQEPNWGRRQDTVSKRQAWQFPGQWHSSRMIVTGSHLTEADGIGTIFGATRLLYRTETVIWQCNE
jgi:hypothetical protein